MSRKLVLTSLAAFLVVAVAAPAYAQGGSDDGTTKTNETAEHTVNTATNTVSPTDDDSTTKVPDDASGKNDDPKTSLRSQRQEIEAKRASLKSEIQSKLDARKEKLAGRRLAQCQNRQESINNLISKSAQIGKDRVAIIKDVETKVKDFYAKKNLSSPDYDTALAAADSAEASAQAAVDVMGTTTFDCTSIDGANPSETIKATQEAKHQALVTFRAAVVHLIQVVKAAHATQQSSASNGAQQ